MHIIASAILQQKIVSTKFLCVSFEGAIYDKRL